MKRENDRRCVNHARVHASAQLFDRCEELWPAPIFSPRFADFRSFCAGLADIKHAILVYLTMVNRIKRCKTCLFQPRKNIN